MKTSQYKTALISLSGGVDSAVVLSHALDKGWKCKAAGFFYGSKHNRYENEAAVRIAAFYDVPFELIDISSAMQNFKSALLTSGGEIPEGSYQEESMKQTVVPARNLIFASILAGLAASQGIDTVWLGIHQGDHAIYPDCRPIFFSALANAVSYATEEQVHAMAPLLWRTKRAVVERGLVLKTPFELTRTCYKDQEEACGLCGSCQERLAAFASNHTRDPIVYATTPI